MKKWLSFFALILLFSLSATCVKAETVTYTKEKHKSIMENVARYKTLHYKYSYVVEDGKKKKLQRMVVRAAYDTESGLIRMVTRSRVTGAELFTSDYVYDYKHDKLFVIKVKGGTIKKKEVIHSLKQSLQGKDAEVSDILRDLVKEYDFRSGMKGKTDGRGEVYRKRLKKVNGIEDKHLKAAAVKYRLKKTRTELLPHKITLKVKSKYGKQTYLSTSVLDFTGFDNRKVELPH